MNAYDYLADYLTEETLWLVRYAIIEDGVIQPVNGQQLFDSVEDLLEATSGNADELNIKRILIEQ